MESSGNYKTKRFKNRLIIFLFIFIIFNYAISPFVLGAYNGDREVAANINSVYQLLLFICCYYLYKLCNSIYANRALSLFAAIGSFVLTWFALGIGFYLVVLFFILKDGKPKEASEEVI